MEFCKNTNIPIGKRVRIVKNFGNDCEPFINLIGTATHPFAYGCCKKDWIGVVLEEKTIYGNRLNFHIQEIIILDN